MTVNEYYRRQKCIEWRMNVLTDRYNATEDTLKRATINIEMGRELNSLTEADMRAAFNL